MLRPGQRPLHRGIPVQWECSSATTAASCSQRVQLQKAPKIAGRNNCRRKFWGEIQDFGYRGASLTDEVVLGSLQPYQPLQKKNVVRLPNTEPTATTQTELTTMMYLPKEFPKTLAQAEEWEARLTKILETAATACSRVCHRLNLMKATSPTLHCRAKQAWQESHTPAVEE